MTEFGVITQVEKKHVTWGSATSPSQWVSQKYWDHYTCACTTCSATTFDVITHTHVGV